MIFSKLIGARFYTADNSARDTNGHGSHTASTAAGNYVKDASFYGIGKGTARGGVPSARIAAYKVCGSLGCNSAEILAAFDDAIADGVDIITISMGPLFPQLVRQDVIAQGALHASQKGILVVQSAGNSGVKYSAISVVPWIFSVAASSTDRGIITKVALGNGTILSVCIINSVFFSLACFHQPSVQLDRYHLLLQGKAVNSFSLSGKSYPLTYGYGASRKCSSEDSR